MNTVLGKILLGVFVVLTLLGFILWDYIEDKNKEERNNK